MKTFPKRFTPKIEFCNIGPRPKLRFNVIDFRKRFNMKAVAIAELAFVKIAGRNMTVTSKRIRTPQMSNTIHEMIG
jgi:hypothetical protein